MSTTTFWLAILGAGAVTFALRLSLIALLGRVEVPPFLERALGYVPAAVLAAVVIPLLFYQDGAPNVSLGNDRLLAGLAAARVCSVPGSDRMRACPSASAAVHSPAASP